MPLAFSIEFISMAVIPFGYDHIPYTHAQNGREVLKVLPFCFHVQIRSPRASFPHLVDRDTSTASLAYDNRIYYPQTKCT